MTVSVDKPRPCPHGIVWLVGNQICMCEQKGFYAIYVHDIVCSASRRYPMGGPMCGCLRRFKLEHGITETPPVHAERRASSDAGRPQPISDEQIHLNGTEAQ